MNDGSIVTIEKSFQWGDPCTLIQPTDQEATAQFGDTVEFTFTGAVPAVADASCDTISYSLHDNYEPSIASLTDLGGN